MFCATEREALNIAIFILEMLRVIENWNDVYKLRNTFKQLFDIQNDSFEYLKYRDFILLGIFEKLGFVLSALKSNVMQVRNLLIFLNKIIDIYPCIQSFA